MYGLFRHLPWTYNDGEFAHTTKKSIVATDEGLQLVLILKNKTKNQPKNPQKSPDQNQNKIQNDNTSHSPNSRGSEYMKCSLVMYQSFSVIKCLSNSIWDQLRV